ncbi:hypothetical protein PYW08_010792 [Mythimna loreyi]|uniref:Uncharacterized protein n=1 Tax=Mythimna loreyi TaxID=667449 RepID=A0ACC2Q493_9NEOP|nr:hypothetical protein PYW08_010792 [Mythimna loreyi]
MEPQMRASDEQFSALLEFMESHGDLSNRRSGPRRQLKTERLWCELVTKLNSIGGGVNISTEEWKKVWEDWKSEVKTKASFIRRHARGTGGGGGPSNPQTLTSLEERVVAIIGKLAVEGMPGIQEAGFCEPLHFIPSPTQTTTSSSSATHQQDAIGYETTIADEPGPISRPTPVTPPSSSWQPLQSETLAQESSTPQKETARRRSWEQSAQPKPSTSPPTSRQRLLSSPRSGITASSSHRSRRLTPFDRATSEFVAVERLRLRQEEKRDRQFHDRESRRIEVDHELNQVLRRLGDIVQAWFDHYRSKDDTKRRGTP